MWTPSKILNRLIDPLIKMIRKPTETEYWHPGLLQQELDDSIEEIVQQFAIELVKEKIVTLNLDLSSKQISKIASKLVNNEQDVVHIGSWKFWDKKKIEVNIQITESELESLGEETTYIVEQVAPALVQSFSDEFTMDILNYALRKWPKEHRRRKNEVIKFRRRLEKRWGKPIETISLMLDLSREFGRNINEILRQRENGPTPHMAEALSRLHSRGCQVTEDIICLLSSGLADGAMARWRTLHELTTVTLLISEFGEELAERFLLYEIVEERRAALQYQAFSDRLGQSPISKDELDDIEESYQKIIDRFGEDFSYPYGWASKHLAKVRPNFSDLELAIGLDHWRPYYKMASQNVHATPQSLFDRLGLISQEEGLLAGPSNFGLDEPGQCTAISLTQLTTAILTPEPNLDVIVLLKILGKLQERASEEFKDALEQLYRDEMDLQNKP